MKQKQNTLSDLEVKLRELKEEAEKEKIQLTPEVEKYIQEQVEMIQGKLAKREKVLQKDIHFIEEVKMWLTIPSEWRESMPSIEKLKKSISLSQWSDIYHLAAINFRKSNEDTNEWIVNTFIPDGQGALVAKNDLEFDGCLDLIRLPENMIIEACLNLNGCENLKKFPEKISIRKNLYFNLCKLRTLTDNLSIGGSLYLGFTENLEKLPDNLSVGLDLDLEGSNRLTSLPENMTVGRNLSITSCPSLQGLPETLEVKGELILAGETSRKVLDDASRLYQEGKVNKHLLING